MEAEVSSLDAAGPEQSQLEIISHHVNHAPCATGGDHDWRSMPELPTSLELLLGGSIPGLLKGNDITVPYQSKDEYLETHYRIQREDAITQLRAAIAGFRQNPDMEDDRDFCIYTKVYVQGYIMTRLGPLCRIEFSTKRAGKKIRWTHTRRLVPGTLVAISTARDNFRTICKTAIIADRLIKGGLDQTPPTIQIRWGQIQDSVIDPSEELVMIEARMGFFEAVRHCMVGLQHVAETDTTHFDKHIVESQKSEQVPTYIRENPQLDLRPLVDFGNPALNIDGQEKRRLQETYGKFDVMKGIPDEVGRHSTLDNSQLEAVHRMLTSELAIVQGPPGTGKTYTSVQALRVLIESQRSEQFNRPIIVAAETNHAVDQILTHLIALKYSVVRLGGRTRDEEMKKYTMFNLRRSWQSKPQNRDSRTRTLEKTRLQVAREFKAALEQVFPSSNDLIEPDVLREYGIITKDQFKSLVGDEGWFCESRDDRPPGVMSEWLGDDLVEAANRQYDSKLFDSEELEEGDEVDEAELNLDLDDVLFGDDEENGRLRGEWVPLKRKWAGANPKGYTDSNFLLQKQLRKKDLWEVDTKLRGAVYEFWQRQLVLRHAEDAYKLLRQYERITKDVKIHRWHQDCEAIQQRRIQIIGCTVTGLTKYRGPLSAMKPRTMLIEEAAQSREANIISALFGGLQQLILVGDHQQGAPHYDTMALGNWPFFLGVSMFERLVQFADMPFTILKKQRRMIPQIRELLNPFYEELVDHPVVLDPRNRPSIPGMSQASYLFHHTWPEGIDPESMSKYNTTEAEMIVWFMRYLIINGNPAKKITVLTFYRGQRKLILRLCRQTQFGIQDSDLNVNTVDSYQGEENDIVILSLVRSNQPNTTARAGFVQDINRGVVSISRAKRGFYVFGNIENLVNATEESQVMWGSVKHVFKEQDRIGLSRLPIRCENHETIQYMSDPDDWAGNHGGCGMPCDGTFEPCGHACPRRCHPMPHERLICKTPCARTLHCGHRCIELCGDKCRCAKGCAALASYAQKVDAFTPQIHTGVSNGRENLRGNGRGGRGKTRRGGLDSGHSQGVELGKDGQPHQWNSYNAERDDARLKFSDVNRQTPRLIETVNDEQVEPAKREMFRRVAIGDEGKREKVGDQVVYDSSSSASPQKPEPERGAPVRPLGAGFPMAVLPMGSMRISEIAQLDGDSGEAVPGRGAFTGSQPRGFYQDTSRVDLQGLGRRPLPPQEAGTQGVARPFSSPADEDEETQYAQSVVAEWELETVAPPSEPPQSPRVMPKEDDGEELLIQF